LKEKLVQLLFKLGILQAIQQVHVQYLTVLNYHRIDTASRIAFDTFKPNVSATPTSFAQQMDLLSRWFRVVSFGEVIAWLSGESSLPPHAALITFDDGYLDNYLQAVPILERYNFPALIFLTTDHIETDRPFYWDLIAYCFYHTPLDHFSLSESTWHWTETPQLDRVIKQFTENLKTYPQDKKQAIVERLPELLNVSIPQGIFRNLMMSWNQVRELKTHGIEFGGHTMTHPILSRVTALQAHNEIVGSKTRIEAETGDPVLGFAYPNGQARDFNPKIVQMVSEAGYRAAFSLINGPESYNAVRQNPYQIKRVFISHKDTLSHMVFKVCGINRLGILG